MKTTIAPTVSIKSLLAPSFYGLHRDLADGRHTHYMLKGGRGSTKSSWVAIEIALGLMREREANAVVLRKVADTLRESVFTQLLWAIDVLGVSAFWQTRLSPLELRYAAGNRIIFRGADEPAKLKSFKFRSGYCKYVWYEEYDEFSPEDVAVINPSLLRGDGGSPAVFYSYNPPQSVQSWVNAQCVGNIREDTLYHHSTYLDVPREWLGEVFLSEAQALKKSNPTQYRHRFLGEVTGTGGEIFGNITEREFTAKEIAGFDHICYGLDFGFDPDPLHFTACHYDRKARRLYIFGELHAVRLSTAEAVEQINREYTAQVTIYADCAEKRTIQTMRDMGLRRITPCRKGQDSVRHGIRWLQDLDAIIIDPRRCPNTLREFSTYEHERDRNGGFKASFPDSNNHSIDAVRYALEEYILRRKIQWR
ncbi:MAG: PBSX family phage terminase large subunit [Clostridium sp.]|jgi:PBSX family phage terminase large subunit|nr:PBSX family phage terminase large subunit [Clostridium sp.]